MDMERLYGHKEGWKQVYAGDKGFFWIEKFYLIISMDTLFLFVVILHNLYLT